MKKAIDANRELLSKYPDIQAICDKAMDDPNTEGFAYERVSGLDFPTVISFIKLKYEDGMQELYEGDTQRYHVSYFFSGEPLLQSFVEDVYPLFEPLTAADVFSMENTELRLKGVEAIGAQNVLEYVNARMVDTQTLSKTNHKWILDEEGQLKEIEEVFNDTYTLYVFDGKEIFRNTDSGNVVQGDNPVYVVECKCTSTDRRYHLYPCVSDVSEATRDAITAIASTIWVEYAPEDIERIHRHGDVIITTAKSGAKPISLRPITKQEYLTKLYAES